jgi:hypothetical protein
LLSCGLPGDNQQWTFLDDADMNQVYEKALAKIGKCDTLVAYLRKS